MADETMAVWRIFSQPDGTSSMEQIEVPIQNGASRLIPGQGVILRRMPRDMKAEWHTAPRRQMLATIAGEGEIETGDGQILVVKPGVITLVEDLEGKGHLTRGRGAEDRLAIVMPLSDDKPLV
jgi:hypothetical protein